MHVPYEIMVITSRAHRYQHPIRRRTSRLAATMAGGLILVGCANANYPTTSQTSPAPVSQEVYQTELRNAGNALKVAFDGIETALPLEPLRTQIDSSASVVRTATQRFGTIVPPPQYVAGQADLVSALNQLANQLADLSVQVQSRELCAAPSAMATLSTLTGVDALRRAASALGSGGLNLATALPAPEPLSDRRESNGKILRSPGSGEGQLKVENNTEHDTAVTLSQDGRSIGSFYVARGETAQLTNIPDGNYDVFFTSGSDWDGGAFTRSCTYEHAEKSWTFTTKPTRDGLTYTIVELKLRGGSDSNVSLVDVPPSSFPK
jgi:hypothetical protein